MGNLRVGVNGPKGTFRDFPISIWWSNHEWVDVSLADAKNLLQVLGEAIDRVEHGGEQYERAATATGADNLKRNREDENSKE